jgi:hypothetical protein
MTESMLAKYVKRPAVSENPDTDSAAAETADDLGCFGFYRGVRDRALYLELMKKDGSILAVGYAWIDRMHLDPSGVITLHTPSQTITITGRNLNREARPQVRLFSGLTRHRVPWIREAKVEAIMRASDGETVIEGIDWSIA